MSTFLEQFDADKLEEVQSDFVELYANYLLGEVEDPLECTVEEMSEWDFSTPPTPAELAPWVEELSESIRWATKRIRSWHERETIREEFYRLRSQGRTIVSIARSMKTTVDDLLGCIEGDEDRVRRELARSIRSAMNEEQRMKGFRARNRLYSSLGKAIQKELETRDLSKVPTEKLINIMLKLTELSRKDETPELEVKVGYMNV